MALKRLIGGWGRSGKAVAAFLKSKGESYGIYDEDQKGASIHSSLESVAWSRYSELILSPGIPLQHPLVSEAEQHGLEVKSEIEFAFERCKGPVIAVTGSNGKSSTVTMLEYIFKVAGLPVQLCGNIGKPFTDAVFEDVETTFIVEISSFQLETIQRFQPRVAILLNVTPDHIDRHGSLENYEAAKLRIFENQNEGDLAIIPPGYREKISGKARVQRVDDPVISGDTLSVAGHTLTLSSQALKPPHQKHNALFAFYAAREMGIAVAQIEKGLNLFPGLKHRMECVGTHRGRTWINDSKATNTDATQVAVYAMTEPYILILGGKNKEADFSVLDFARNPPRSLVVYGKAAEEIAEALIDMNPTIVKLFKDACLFALNQAKRGDSILLSPGCSSFDQFGNFELRGEAFRAVFDEISAETEGRL